MSFIKSYNVGNGDMFYIEHENLTGTIIDCNLINDDVEQKILKELNEFKNQVDFLRFISTHPDEDHIKGIKKLDEKGLLYNIYLVKNESKKVNETDSFKFYKNLINDNKYFEVKKGIKRAWLNVKKEDENDNFRDSSNIEILWPDINNEEFIKILEDVKKCKSFNNLSTILKYEIKGRVFLWFGDIETDYLNKIESKINLPESVDVLFAPHHGRNSGKITEEILKKINPKLIVIGSAPSESLNYYNGYNAITQNQAKDIIFKIENNKIEIFVENENYNPRYNKFKVDANNIYKGLYYIGSI